MVELEHADVETNGVRLHVVRAGPSDGPFVILLHGFPEFWYGWDKQVGPLAEAGFLVWVPDERGYNSSARPKGVMAYHLEELGLDVVGLVRAAGRERATIIGHDWGGVVAWAVAGQHPQVVERLGIINAPHPVVMTQALRGNLRQMLKSWYVFYFQLPWLPEFAASRRDFHVLRRVLGKTSRPGTFSDDVLSRYASAWSEPGALEAMIDYYRASWRRPLPSTHRIRAETLILWGTQDAFLGEELVEPSARFCDKVRVQLFPEAGHWILREEAERLNRQLIDFVRGGLS